MLATFSAPGISLPLPWSALRMNAMFNDARDVRLLYALGPGDVVGMYRDMLEGREPAYEMSIAFSKLFLDWCDKSADFAHLVSSHVRRDSVRHGRYLIENLPKPSSYYAGGIKHHGGSLAYGLTLIRTAIRERPSAVIVDSGTTHWIIWSMLSLWRIPVIAVMHSTIWPMGFPPKRFRDRLLRTLDGIFFRRFAAAIVCVSPECERQVRAVAKGKLSGPVYQCRAQFHSTFRTTVNPVPRHSIRPFRVLFVGRIERIKGVFLILSMAERLEQQMPGQFRWKIIGVGSASAELENEVSSRNLSNIVEVTGRLPRKSVVEAYGWAHANVVPTTAEYIEGLAMTAAEAVLAGRPVVLSTVVPAWEVLGDAAIRVDAGNVDSFVDAFRKLALDADYYERCRRATIDAQAQFCNASEGLGTVLGRAISATLHHSAA